jgi:hypothetical protein
MESNKGIVSTVVEATLGRVVNGHITNHDAAERERLLAAVPCVVVSEYTIVPLTLIATFKSLAVQFRYFVYGLFLLIGSIYLLTGMGPEETIGSVFASFARIMWWYLLAVAALTILYFAKQRGRARYIPFGLHSRHFSLLSELIVTKEGIDGFFALPWQRVTKIERPDANTIVFMYTWRPNFLTSFLRVNRTTVWFMQAEQAAEVVALCKQFKIE